MRAFIHCVSMGCLGLIGLVFCHAGAEASSRWRPAHRRNQNPKLVQSALRPKRLALLIGIGQYTSAHWPNLRYASKDVVRMRRALSKHGKFDQITTLVGRANTTKKRIWKAIRQLRRRNTSPWDTIMVYVSAHGTVAYPSGQQRNGARFVVTSDTRDNIPATALSVTAIRKQLEQFVSRRKVLMLATCYTGAAGSKSKLAPGNKGQLVYQAARRSRTMLILSAASLHQPAFESKALKSDVYTHFFMRCLQRMSAGRMPASASRIHACAVGPTFRYVKKTFGQVQLPGLESRIDGLDAVYLTGPVPTSGKPTKRKRSRAMVQVLRRQLQRWRIRFFRRGQKGVVAKLEQEGDVLMSLAPGRYRVSMEAQDGIARRSFSLHVRSDSRQVLSPPWPLAVSLEAGVQSSVLSSVPLQAGASGAFRVGFLSLHLGYWGGVGQYTSSSFSQHQLDLRLEAAWMPWWRRFGLVLGGFVGGSLLLQSHVDGLHYGPMFQYGIKAGPRFRIHHSLSLSLYARAGFAVLSLDNALQHRFWFSANLGVAYEW